LICWVYITCCHGFGSQDKDPEVKLFMQEVFWGIVFFGGRRVLGIEPSALSMLGAGSTTELYSQLLAVKDVGLGVKNPIESFRARVTFRRFVPN
jgi:hypothetical protein